MSIILDCHENLRFSRNDTKSGIALQANTFTPAMTTSWESYTHSISFNLLPIVNICNKTRKNTKVFEKCAVIQKCIINTNCT